MSLSFPTYPDDHLATSSTADLWRLLVQNEDTAPRNLIDECARRGDESIEQAAALLEKPYYWEDDQSPGEWWVRLHAVMILGLIPSERAGALLAAFMRRMDEAQDENLQEWLSGHWASLFRNKPTAALPHLITFAEDRSRGWYARVDAIQALLGYARNAGGDCLEDVLSLTARIVFDETEDFEVRSMAGSSLLDFARPEYRRGLEALADQQPKDLPVFDRDSVEDVYDRGNIPPPYPRFEDPWQFYAPEAIEERQRRWAEEDAVADADDAEDRLDEPGVTYVRPAPRIGRNDPCPCGSGKKYKKCCLSKEVSPGTRVASPMGRTPTTGSPMIPVDSTAIARAGYDPRKRILRLEYRNGRIYDYFDVPPEIYKELLSTESAGEFVNLEIKPNYDYSEVE